MPLNRPTLPALFFLMSARGTCAVGFFRRDGQPCDKFPSQCEYIYEERSTFLLVKDKRLFERKPEQSQTTGKYQLLAYIQEHTATLLGTLRLFVSRSGVASGTEVPAVALELLQETVVEALAHVDRYQVDKQPMAWLLGIAINLIKRRKVAHIRLAQREVLLGHLAQQTSQQFSEADLLDQLLPSAHSGPEQEVEGEEQVQHILALVSNEDQHILRLAFLEDFDDEALASRLVISPGAARMRLHRALKRLRSAWFARQSLLERGTTHE